MKSDDSKTAIGKTHTCTMSN